MNQLQVIEPATTVTAGDVFRILWRRSWAIVLLIGAALGISYLVSIHTPPRFKAVGSLLLMQRQATLITTPQGANSAPVVENPETQLVALQSIGMAKRAIDWMKNDALRQGKRTDEFNLDPKKFSKVFTCVNPKDTNILEITAEADTPEMAVQRVEALGQAFIDWKRQIMSNNNNATLENLEVRAQKAHNSMLEAERQETAFKQGHRLADVSTQQQNAVAQYLQRDAEVKSAEQDVVASRAKLKNLGERLKDVNEKIRTGEGVRDDTLVASLQSQLNALEIERAKQAQLITPDFPGPNSLPNMDAQINELRERLTKAVHNTLDNKKPSLQSQGQLFEDYKQTQTALIFSESKLKAATAVRDQLHVATTTIPQTSMEYARLSRNTEMARQLHTQLQSALNAARLDKDMASGNVVFAQHALTPVDPFLPNRIRDMGFGGAIGLLLSMVAVLMLEQGDRRVRSVDSVRRLVSGPVVGALPRMSRRQLSAMEDTQAVEAFSLARANLSLAVRHIGGGHLWDRQIVMVTSAVPGEGKSFTAFHMARSLARSGRNVILVDADMRHPAQNKLFGTKEPIGLAEVLSGKLSLNEAIVSSDIHTLGVLHSGTPDRNPSELFSLPNLIDLLNELRSEADIIVIDTPACSVVADALLLAPHADCILHVVGAGQVDQDLVNETTAALQAAAPKTMAFFVNRAPRERRRRGNGDYYYYYQTPTPAGAIASKGKKEPAAPERDALAKTETKRV